MNCDYCDNKGIHLCSGRIKAYNDSFTPEQHEQRRAERMETLQKAIDAGKVLKEQYGIELVCKTPMRLNQKTLDYLESVDRGEVELTKYDSSEELFQALGI